ncbi:conserved hypothetical protein [Culex quinquefasciatus]|uniref:Cadherin domain-containing protein n=1 Tax=Culex quinquefasciatus TaxID=7176 RepID=B0X4T5_CULQU|nr:conserved hypothetical protein [Culex quinquefasciatus]|eukprot:XP_001864657.1 conserved hypothetical protein [Culex quinquefasciatus]
MSPPLMLLLITTSTTLTGAHLSRIQYNVCPKWLMMCANVEWKNVAVASITNCQHHRARCAVPKFPSRATKNNCQLLPVGSHRIHPDQITLVGGNGHADKIIRKQTGWLLLLLLPSLVFAQDPPGTWQQPYAIPVDAEKVSFLGYDSLSSELRVSMWEEMVVPFKLVELNYHGPEADIKITNSGQTGAVLHLEGGKHFIVINNKMDYEVAAHRTSMVYLSVGNSQIFLAIDLINILDNVPVMSSAGPCSVDEGLENYLSNCEYTVFHADGFVTNGILGNDTNAVGFDLPETNAELFKFEEVVSGGDNYNKKFKLKVLKKLDYTQNAVYSFLVTVYDLNRTHTATQNIVVQVINVESRDPVFTRPFTTQRIDEKSPYSTIVQAIDGDTGLGRPICYEIVTEQEKYAEYFSIGRETGELNVKPINRDHEQNEFYQFTIWAYKCHNREFNESNVGAIILNDLNDSPPVFSVEPTQLKFWENTPMELDFEQFTIDDLDLGPHATYSVDLQERVSNELLEDVSSFSITPRSGYQRVNFTLTVVNPAELDYEVLARQKFDLLVTAKEEVHTTVQVLNIELLNWNDEVPQFELDTYRISCRETVEEGYQLVTVHVTDRDIEDSVELEILSNIRRDLNVTKLESTVDKQYSFLISTNRNDVFDWDIASEVVVQLQASDTLQTEKNEQIHHVFAQLIITVLDVNNKPPSIVLPRGSIHIEENSAPGTVASIAGEDATIIGTDPDSSAELVFSIDWEKSYAVKTGATVSFTIFEGCLVFQVDRTNPNHVVGKLVVNPDYDQATINQKLDYEAYETLFLNIKLVDMKQEIPPGDTETLLVIQIDDVNDNAPEFVDSTLTDERFVLEEATAGSIVGSIAAIDKDGPLYNQITYSLRATNPNHAGWISIDPLTGLLSVNATETNPINCDDPITADIPLDITITDGEFTASGQVSVKITDTNNQNPLFSVPDDQIIRILEKPPVETEIQRLRAKDLDRDEPFHTAAFELDLRTYPELQRYFDIVREQEKVDDRMINIALVRVRPNGEKLDRDAGPAQHQIKVIAIDNPNSSGRRNSDDTTFTLVLLDVNDNRPELPVHGELKLSENTAEGVAIVDVFEATDRDDRETPNAKINYRILQISAGRL